MGEAKSGVRPGLKAPLRPLGLRGGRALALVSDMRERLTGAGLAVYPSVERAVRALATHTKYWQRRNRG